mmetsp:Transcript_70080/g.116843  ORF Transcript_70080/g.116843 Transcript_70080/m.116843 type:complete len:151 (-) Transcript_70080:394-846(-)
MIPSPRSTLAESSVLYPLQQKPSTTCMTDCSVAALSLSEPTTVCLGGRNSGGDEAIYNSAIGGGVCAQPQQWRRQKPQSQPHPQPPPHPQQQPHPQPKAQPQPQPQLHPQPQPHPQPNPQPHPQPHPNHNQNYIHIHIHPAHLSNRGQTA